MIDRNELAQLVQATAEVCGGSLNATALALMVADLEECAPDALRAALTRCRREVRGRLTLADIISRIDDGRPGAEAAWAQCPRDEATTAVWTDEMAASWGVALPLLVAGDHVAARMAFVEDYRKRCQSARDRGEPVRWLVSLGFDVSGREGPIRDAVAAGRLTVERAQALIPGYGESARLAPPRHGGLRLIGDDS